MPFAKNHQRMRSVRQVSAKGPALLILLALAFTSIVWVKRNVSAKVPVFASAPSAKAKPYSRHASKNAIKWADKQLKQMSLEEKVGQLISVGINATYLNQDSAAFKALRHQVVDNHVGGIILFRGPVYESVVIVNRMQQLAKHPLL